MHGAPRSVTTTSRHLCPQGVNGIRKISVDLQTVDDVATLTAGKPFVNVRIDRLTVLQQRDFTNIYTVCATVVCHDHIEGSSAIDQLTDIPLQIGHLGLNIPELPGACNW